ASLAMPDITGLIITNMFDAVNTNLLNALQTSVPGIKVGISNVLNIRLVVANVPQSWSAVASSADGSELVAAANGGLIYISTDSGATWMPTGAPSTNWSAIAMSADGSQLLAAVKGGLLYTSSNSGATWVPANLPAANWCATALAADGSELVALVDEGPIYLGQVVQAPVLGISAM